MVVPLYRYGDITSTQDAARDRLLVQQPPFAVIARSQGQGRGRHGRQWVSEEGNIYCTYVCAATGRTTDYAFITAVALRETISTIIDEPVGLKWPNDLQINQQKCGGILIEQEGPALIIGFGINIAFAPEGAVYLNQLADHKLEPDMICQSALDNLDSWIERYKQDGFVSIRAEWMKHAAFLDKPISIEKGRYTGIFKGMDKDGAALIQTEEKEQIRILSGDVMPL